MATRKTYAKKAPPKKQGRPVKAIKTPSLDEIEGSASDDIEEIETIEEVLDDVENFLNYAGAIPQSKKPPLIKLITLSDAEIDSFNNILNDEEKALLDKLLSKIESRLDVGTEIPAGIKNKSKGKVPMSHNGTVTTPDGIVKFYKNGKLHRDGDLPAEIRPNGTQLWYKNGKLHREGNQPAMIGINGSRKYAVNGNYHRVGGPAITWSKGPERKEFWNNGHLQYTVDKDGVTRFFAPETTNKKKGVFHREDGPAVIYPNGAEEFFLEGQIYLSRSDWSVALIGYQQKKAELASKVIKEELSNEGKKMNTTKPGLTEMMKSDAKNAAYRVAGTQASKAVKTALVQIMKNKGASGGHLEALSEFLDTEIGQGIIQLALGMGLQYAPHFGEDPRVQRLAGEMRIGGMATAGNAIIGEAMEHLLPALTTVLKALPAEEETSVRVESSSLAKKMLEETREEEDESEMEVAPAKTAKV